MVVFKYHFCWEYIFWLYIIPTWQTSPFIKDKNYLSVINMPSLLSWTCLQLSHQGDTLPVAERSGCCCSRNQRHCRASNSCPSSDHNPNTHHTPALLGAGNSSSSTCSPSQPPQNSTAAGIESCKDMHTATLPTACGSGGHLPVKTNLFGELPGI